MTLRTRNNILSVQDYNPFGEEIRNYVNGGTNDKYKFTGKERDKESGLDYFGARYYDSEVGRWLSVDPMAAKYPGWSPYNYCLNNPLGLIDPDGMDCAPGDKFKSKDAAAEDWANYYNGFSIVNNLEYSSSIYEVKNDDGSTSYSYTEANIGGQRNVGESTPQNGERVVATIHSHSAYDSGLDGDNFSPGDYKNADNRGKDSYLASPNGVLQVYQPKVAAQGKYPYRTISTTIPSDKRDPDCISFNYTTIVNVFEQRALFNNKNLKGSTKKGNK